jgi:D-3-phosphoglycerate dehydrogenase
MTDDNEKYRVLITGPSLANEAAVLLDERCSYRITGPYPKPDQIATMAAENQIQGIIVRMGRITREVLTSSPDLRIVVKHGVGVDNIDVEAATELGIPVCITPYANYQSVAEHALSMMLALAKNLFLLDQQIRNGVWDKTSNPPCELYRKTLGIIGAGRIGRRLAELVQPLEMTVIGYDPFLPQGRFPESIRRVKRLEKLLREADFVSLHCPKTEETSHMIGEKELKMMKATAILINTARGGIVDETALLRALEDRIIRGAGMDCFAMEPLPQESPLLRIQDRLIVTPHIGGGAKESFVRMGIQAANILLGYLERKELDPDVLINPAALARRS